MIKSNLHTHTLYCDGINTIEEMVIGAIEKGFHTLGFSEHGYTRSPAMCHMSVEDTPKYIAEVRACADKYKDKINIFVGIENDSFGTQFKEGLDYTIGSVHGIMVDDTFYCLDNTADIAAECINGIFKGDSMEVAKRYYEAIIHNVTQNKPDIIGHFDIITKFQDSHHFYDTDSKQYRDYALTALDEVLRVGGIIEVNTGAISRGYRKTPYPDSFILHRLKEKNAPVTVSADAHSTEGLDCFFKETEELLINHGIKYIWQLTDKGFVETPLR